MTEYDRGVELVGRCDFWCHMEVHCGDVVMLFVCYWKGKLECLKAEGMLSDKLGQPCSREHRLRAFGRPSICGADAL